MKKALALYFRFALYDDSFHIHVDDERISHEHLAALARSTQFLWVINDLTDPFVEHMKTRLRSPYEPCKVKVALPIRGFIASVELPSQLKIRGTDEKVSVDLFVNGRLRDKDILKHIPSARVVESYLYGQIHYDGMDDETDRFATSREGIVADDPMYRSFLGELKKFIAKVMKDWDRLRTETNQDGDGDNRRLSRKQRKAQELFNVVAKEYTQGQKARTKDKVNRWVAALADDAQFNFSSYADCFISENLVRTYILERGLVLSGAARKDANHWRRKERENKDAANLSISLRRCENDLNYLAMDRLAEMVDPDIGGGKAPALTRDAREYRPIRNALAHTALLTPEAQAKLTTVYVNIRERIRTLLSE